MLPSAHKYVHKICAWSGNPNSPVVSVAGFPLKLLFGRDVVISDLDRKHFSAYTETFTDYAHKFAFGSLQNTSRAELQKVYKQGGHKVNVYLGHSSATHWTVETFGKSSLTARSRQLLEGFHLPSFEEGFEEADTVLCNVAEASLYKETVILYPCKEVSGIPRGEGNMLHFSGTWNPV